METLDMDWYDQPNVQEAPAQPASTAPATRSTSGIRRGLITAVLSAGLLIAGGVAVVNAASPDPSASTSPNATQPSTNGSGGTAPSAQPRGGGAGHNCPQDGSGGTNGSGTDNSGSGSSSGASSSDA
ncbi:MAG: hypothetical protein ACJ77B_09980 [Chloroflexota bacterium]